MSQSICFGSVVICVCLHKNTIPLTLDEKGFIDRSCPKCDYQFKVKDWPHSEPIFPWERTSSVAFCPRCGHKASTDKWHTSEQIEAAKKIAIAKAKQQIFSQLDKSFANLAQSFRQDPFIRVEYKSPFHPLHISMKTPFQKALEREIVCQKCSATYAVIGSAFFCPVCGENTVVSSFAAVMSNIATALDTLPATRKVFVEHGGVDFAEDQIRHLIERSVGDIVSVFQSYALNLYERMGGAAARPNDFQMVDKGSALFKRLVGNDYSDWMSTEELKFMNRMFQRRHLLEHNNGLVDQRYIDKTRDTQYKVNERLVTRIDEVRRLQSIVLKLGNGLQQLHHLIASQA